MVSGSNYSSRPFISRAAIAEALTALLHHSIYEPSLSLYNLTLVDEYLVARSLPPMENARAYAISNILADLIIQNYQKYRAIRELSPVDVTAVESTSLDNIREDASTNSNDLMGWSVLYYRYIRTELELSQDDLSKLINVSDKTIRRYQTKGLNAFTDVLITEEQHARKRVNKLYLQAALPSSRVLPLFSRELLAQKASQNFVLSPALPVIISGPVGIGKTTLAEEIARRRIYIETAPELSRLIWISSPRSLEDIFYQVESQLADVDYGDFNTADFSLLNTNVFVVIDNADVLSSQDIEHCLKTLNKSALMITLRSFRPQYQPVLHIALKELEPDDEVRAYLDYLLQHETTVEITDKDIQHLYQMVGGNPLALKLAVQSQYSGDLSAIQNDISEFFQSLFRTAHAAVQQAWIAIAFATQRGVVLKTLSMLRPDIPATAFFELVDKQVAQFHPDDQRITLLPVARSVVLAQHQENNVADFAIHALTQLLQNSDNVQSAQADHTLFLETLLKTTLDSQIVLPDDLVDEVIAILQAHPMLRSPHTWLILLEWRSHQQTDDLKLKLEFARALRKMHYWERAQLEFENLIAVSGQSGNFLLQAETMLEFAILMRQRGAYSQAQRLLNHARQITLRFRAEALYAQVQLNYAQIAIDQSDAALALSYLNNLPMTTEWIALKAEAALLTGEIDSGLQLTRTALRQSIGNSRYTATLQILLGRLYHAQGNDRKARKELERAVITLEAISYSFALGRAWMNLGIVLSALGYRHDARELLDRSAALQEQSRDWVGLEITKYNLDRLE